MHIGRAADHLHSLFRAVVLNRAGGRQFCPPGNVCQCLEMFWGLTTGGLLPASSWERLGKLLNIPQCTEHHPPRRVIQSKMAIVPRLRNPALEEPRQPLYLAPNPQLARSLVSRILKLEIHSFGLCQSTNTHEASLGAYMLG